MNELDTNPLATGRLTDDDGGGVEKPEYIILLFSEMQQQLRMRARLRHHLVSKRSNGRQSKLCMGRQTKPHT